MGTWKFQIIIDFFFCSEITLEAKYEKEGWSVLLMHKGKFLFFFNIQKNHYSIGFSKQKVLSLGMKYGRIK